MNLFYQHDIDESHPQLDESESLHAIKVLRHQVGDSITVTNGRGSIFHTTIESIRGKTCTLKILRVEKQQKPKHYIHIAIAPTKSTDRIEWFVEKATEMGIQEITFLNTHHGERPRINLDRMIKTAVGAIKQSGQPWLPILHDLTDFHQLLATDQEQKFIAHVPLTSQGEHLFHAAKKGGQYLVMIGPEGDFSSQELELAMTAGFKPISLGLHTLRTETAGLAACHTLNLLNL